MRLICRELDRYLLGVSVAEPLSDALSAHLETCESCRERWRRIRRADRRMTECAKPLDSPLPPSAPSEIMRRIREEESSRRRSIARCVPALAAVALLAAGGWAIRSLPGSRDTASKRSAPSVRRVAGIADSHESVVKRRSAPPSASRSPETKTKRLASVPIRDHPIVAIRARGKGGQARPAFVQFTSPPRSESENRLADSAAKAGDDFVTVPEPLVAANPSSATDKIVADAVARYQEEKAVTDARLDRKTDLEMPGGDLKELTETLTRETGVGFYVSKEMEDWKLTVYMKQAPVKDLMRQVALLFNAQWRRYGETGKYRYDLMRTFRQRLAEEELKRQDQDQMLLDVVDNLEPYRELADQPKEDLKRMAQEADDKAKTAGSVEERAKWRDRRRVLTGMTQDKYGQAFKMYDQLTPDQLLALRQGKDIVFSSHPKDGESPLPQEATDFWTQKSDKYFKSPVLHFYMDENRPDHANLMFKWEWDSGSHSNILTAGQPDAMRSPGNAESHASLKSDPAWRQPSTLQPDAKPPSDMANRPQAADMLKQFSEMKSDLKILTDGGGWIDSAQFFAELHKSTGRNVVADYYDRIYLASDFKADKEPILDILNRAADLLKSNWTTENGFLRFRRVNYYSEREIEVSNRTLAKWSANRAKLGSSSLDDLAEMASLPDAVITHPDLERALMIRRGLDEWPLARASREALRFYSTLGLDQRVKAASDAGLSALDLTPEQRAACAKIIGANAEVPVEELQKDRLYFWLQERGSYVWGEYSGRHATHEFKDKDQARAAFVSEYKKNDPKATDDQIEADFAKAGLAPKMKLFFRDSAGFYFYEGSGYSGDQVTKESPAGYLINSSSGGPDE